MPIRPLLVSQDKWEEEQLAISLVCRVSPSDEAVSSEGLYV